MTDDLLGHIFGQEVGDRAPPDIVREDIDRAFAVSSIFSSFAAIGISILRAFVGVVAR
ncbi:hypothetical protein [Natrialba asiatica]|nr:hypothetical protein [Natrialba asiatica]